MRNEKREKRKILFFSFLFFFAALNVFSSAIREEQNNAKDPPPVQAVDADGSPAVAGKTMTIQGQVKIYGNEPHTFVGIADQDGTEYAVYPSDKEDELRSLQGHIIEFTVILLNEPQGFGSLSLKGGTVTPIKWQIIR